MERTFFCKPLETAAKRRWESEGIGVTRRCAGFSVTEIGNRKERLRVREAGASAAGRGQRPCDFRFRHAEIPHSGRVTPIPQTPFFASRRFKATPSSIYRKAINVVGNPRTSGSWRGLGQSPNVPPRPLSFHSHIFRGVSKISPNEKLCLKNGHGFFSARFKR